MDYSRFIRRRLTNLGVSRSDAVLVARWYIQQLSNQGEIRAIDYFKRVGDTILWYLYGSPERPAWVKTKHRFPTALYFLKKYDEMVLARIAKFARSIRLDKVHEHQAKKVVQGASKPYGGSLEGRAWFSQLIQLGVSHYGLKPRVDQPIDPRPIGRCFRRVMSLSGPTKLTMEPPILESLEIVNRVPALYGLPYWKEAFIPLTAGWLEDYFERFQGTEGHAVGEIHAAQEGGGKLRMYASPYSIVQCLLYPIHYWIDTYRSQLRTDCTYDQLSGAQWAQDRLNAGTTVYSVDLSTATCRFPLEVQMDLIQGLGLADPFCEALKWACKGEWIVGSELIPQFPSSLSWQVGQPLGIAPSMSMFSFAHNLLITGMCVELGLTPESSFRVLGDDVVMVNAALYELYTRAMSLVDVPISWNKTHQSDKVAEFAGCTISRSMILRPGQWREAGITNHLSLSKDLGTPLNGEVSPMWIDIEKIYLFARGLYTPGVPEWSKYLRYSTLLSRTFDGKPPSEVMGEYWETSVRCLIRRMFHGLDPEFGPRTDDWTATLYKGLPSNQYVEYWKDMSSWLTHDNPDDVFIQAWTALVTSLEQGLLTIGGYESAVETLVANTQSLYWRVPKLKHSSETSEHHRIMSVLVS